METAMKNVKSGLLAVVAAGALVGISAGFIHTVSVAADEPQSGTGVARIACTPAPGNWTDCSVTVDQSIPAGGSVAAELDSRDAQVAFCSEESRYSDFSTCGVSGNAAVFSCPNGCAAGSQFALSALGTSTATLAQNFTLASSITVNQSPGPLQIEGGPASVQDLGH
jgi:hypothetical protein